MMVNRVEHRSVYISYPAGTIVETIEVGGEGSEVLVDVDEIGRVAGIEIIDVAISENVALARRFAAERGLAFPQQAGSVTFGADAT